jgi:hypothetical protein
VWYQLKKTWSLLLPRLKSSAGLLLLTRSILLWEQDRWGFVISFGIFFLILCHSGTFYMKKVRDRTLMNVDSLRISLTAMDPIKLCVTSGHSAGEPDEIHEVRMQNNWSRIRTLPLKRHKRFLGAFVKLWKANVSFVMSARLSAWNNSAPTGRNFIKFDICIFFENMPRKFRFR